MRKLLLLAIVILTFTSIAFADDEYKPYLHKATVPEHPEVRLFGKYSTSMFPGAASYSYPIEVPKGTNGLQPALALAYNSQSVKQRPGMLGAGWSITPSYVYRDVNSTVLDVSDDKFILILEGTNYELVFNPGDNKWHTEVEYHYKVENDSGNWLLTKKNGNKYYFNYTLGTSRWYLSHVKDTHNNNIFYSYTTQDTNAVYLNKIQYNNDKTREIVFAYDNSRPDQRLVYDNGMQLQQSRRLTDISVNADTQLVRRYHLDYLVLAPTLTSVSKITYYGSDNTSILHNISFDYYDAEPGFDKNTSIYVPPVLFSNDAHDDYGARLVDFNSDGYIDIVQRKGGDNKAWVNAKNSSWVEDTTWKSPLEIVSGSTDQGVRFADVNYDGYPDILKAKAGSSRAVYLNNKTGWNLTSLTIPVDFVDSSGNDQGVRLSDVNGDGKIDMIKARGTKTVYLNNGAGWTSSSWIFPVDFLDSGYKDHGVRVIDLNGDGLTDILKGEDGTRTAWLNNGTGWYTASSWSPPTDFTTSSKIDNGVRLADVNGDGLTDLLRYSDSESSAWLNNGTGWVQDDNWTSPEAFTTSGYNVGRRLADVNGDGLADVVVSHQDSGTQYTWLKNTTTPFMLKQIINEYGGTTTVNYTKSTQFNNSESGSSDIGFNIFVVSGVSADNNLDTGFSVTGNNSYVYAFGKYNYDNNEFRGFGRTDEITDTKSVSHYFYQDDPRRGKEYKTEVYDLSGNIYSKNMRYYNWTKEDGIYNLSLRMSSDYTYDGDLEDPLVTNKSYLYDGFGNLRVVVDHGDVSIQGDEKHIEYTYAYNTRNWIMDKPASKIVYDANNLRIKDTRYYYDELGFQGMDYLGELTKVEQWNDNGNNSYTYYDYDTYGNVVSETDPLGNKVKYTYGEYHTHPVSVVNAVGHITYYSYDFGTANLLWEEKNNVRKSFEYDTFGRVSQEIMPYDTSESPTKEYNYYFDGSAPEKVKVTLKTTADNSYDIWYYYDGVGNLVQLKTDFGSQQVVKNIFYDTSFRVSYEQNPYFADYSETLSNVSSSNYTYYIYDPLDRVIAVINPDGTVKNVSFDHYEITDYDENGNKHKYTLDGLGRIVSVTEYNVNDVGISEEYLTSYEYDRNDNLVKITDSTGNKFLFGYDTLGRKISMSDPDLGNWSYSYDNNGNLISQTDSRGEVIFLTYDGLNRVLFKDSDEVDITFSYDKDYYGTLSSIVMDTVVFNYTYDERLRVAKETKFVEGVSFDTEFLYDSQDRMISKQGLSELDFISNNLGKVQKIPGYIDNSTYNAFGSILTRDYNNGLSAQFTYNSENNRLSRIFIPSTQDISYTYDNVGNILSITDAISNKNHVLAYDNLDRLVNATIGSDVYKYSFSPIGNIMKIIKNNESKKFVYQGSQAHAPSRIITGGLGVDVYNPKDIGNGSKDRAFEFFLKNENSEPVSDVELSVDFGDGNSFTDSSLDVDDNLWVIVQNNYSHGGDYSLNVTADYLTTGDSEILGSKFGARAYALSKVYSNTSTALFEFAIYNDIIEEIEQVSWTCDEVASVHEANMSGFSEFFNYIAMDYALPGNKKMTCTVNSLDGSEVITLDYGIKGTEIDNFDVMKTGVSSRITGYTVTNYFEPASTVIAMDGDSQAVDLNSGESIMVFSEDDYSTDGLHQLDINITAGNYSTKHVDTFTIEGVSIENYDRQTVEHTKNVITFDVRNTWHTGNVNWSLDDPSISDSTYLLNNETLLVVIEDQAAGTGRTEVLAAASIFEDKLKNAFEIKPIKIDSLLTLSEGVSTISEMIIQNNLNGTQDFTLNFNDTEDAFDTSLITVSDKVFVIVESELNNTGVYKTLAYINTSTFN
ncbi:FG-GAP-like repeat-containing protein, partial [Nanoarchaeota archaeon]